MIDPVPPNAVLCAGRLYCDLVFTGAPNLPVMGTETFCEDLSLHAGGGAFITAATFSALGWKTSLLSTLPVAPFDAIVCNDIASFGVDAKYCSKAATGGAPQLTVAIARENDRAFLSHKTGAALPERNFDQGKFRHLHIGELRSLVEHPSLVEKARQSGMTISVDCGWDSELMAQGANMGRILSEIDVFLPNETEYDHLRMSGLIDGTAPLTVVKCGGDGARALEHRQWITSPAIHANIVDTTGAGDAFNGGFLSSWLSGKSLEACLSLGNQCGRLAVEKAGGTGGLLHLQSNLAASQSGLAR